MKGLAGGTCPRPKLLSFGNKMKRKHISRKAISVHGSVRRSRSIQIDPDNVQGRYSIYCIKNRKFITKYRYCFLKIDNT